MNDTSPEAQLFGEPNSPSKRRLALFALVLIPVLLFGGNYVMDKLTAALAGQCLVVDTNATLCVHRNDS